MFALKALISIQGMFDNCDPSPMPEDMSGGGSTDHTSNKCFIPTFNIQQHISRGHIQVIITTDNNKKILAQLQIFT